jgi:hypothetical protein
MRRREPDVEAFRSALARELVAVAPRPGGWERVSEGLRRPAGRRRPRRLAWLLLAAPLVAGALLAALAAAAGTTSARSAAPAQAVAAPPVVAVCAALAALTSPIASGEGRRGAGRLVCARPA